MKRFIACQIVGALIACISFAQTPTPQKPELDDVVRITTQLVQTDVVVTDKNDQPITDLKLEDFEVYDSGKKQDLKFVELVTTDAPMTRSSNSLAQMAPGVDASVARNLSARDVRRVMAFSQSRSRASSNTRFASAGAPNRPLGEKRSVAAPVFPLPRSSA